MKMNSLAIEHDLDEVYETPEYHAGEAYCHIAKIRHMGLTKEEMINLLGEVQWQLEQIQKGK